MSDRQQDLRLIEEHVRAHIGEPERAPGPELLSEAVRVDVFVVKPAPGRNFYTLITSGMSSLAMRSPVDHAAFAWAELMMCLPPDWPLLEDKDRQWPVDVLKHFARAPHKHRAWFFENSTMSNGVPPRPFPGTQMNNALLMVP